MIRFGDLTRKIFAGKPRASGDDPFIKDVAANLTE